ncbi:MAG: hypothetical protein U0V70_02635 [Terriglobia bacterium]
MFILNAMMMVAWLQPKECRSLACSPLTRSVLLAAFIVLLSLTVLASPPQTFFQGNGREPADLSVRTSLSVRDFNQDGSDVESAGPFDDQTRFDHFATTDDLFQEQAGDWQVPAFQKIPEYKWTEQTRHHKQRVATLRLRSGLQVIRPPDASIIPFLKSMERSPDFQDLSLSNFSVHSCNPRSPPFAS